MRRVIVLAMLALFVSQCESGKLDVGSEEEKPEEKLEEKPTDKVDSKKVADLSFADGSELHIEVGEKFDIVVNVNNIDRDNLADDLDWTDHSGNPMDREGDPRWHSLAVTSKFMVKGKAGNILWGGYSDTRVKDIGGVIKIEGFYFTETCADDCHIVFGLRISGMCVGDSGCESAQVKPVDEISKTVVVKKSSYAAQVERVSGKNIKLTITKDGEPLANGSAKVRALVRCEQSMGWTGCAVPPDISLIYQTVKLDTDGSWSTELDDDGSWLRAAQEAESDYTLNVCEVEFNITADGREFDDLTPTGGGC